MPDESCRKCGGILVNCSLCASCKKIIQRICNKCGSKTEERFHNNCLYLESHQSRNKMILQISHTTPNMKKIANDYQHIETGYHLRNAVLVFGIVGFFVLGFAAINYFNFFQNQTNEAQVMKTTVITTQVSHAQENIPQRLYENCIGYGNEKAMTVTCPTESGYVYKAVLVTPSNLAATFANQVFSTRGISLNENLDGSIIIQYQKTSYRTNFYPS